MSLNPEQTEALAKFRRTMLRKDEDSMLLTGSAGTGKTFTVSRMLNELKTINQANSLIGGTQITSVFQTATTNKAAAVLTQASGTKTETLHKLFQLVPTPDYKTGKQTLKQKQYVHLTDALLVIDEAFTMNPELLDKVMECTSNCKFLFVGDPYQLLPVGEDSSPVVDMEIPEAVLTIPMRNEGPIELLANQFKEAVVTGVIPRIAPIGNAILQPDNPNDVLNIIDSEIINSGSDTKILTYTNNAADSYIKHIRARMGKPPHPVVDDVVVSNTYTKSAFIERNSIMNEFEYVVTAVSDPYVDTTLGIPVRTVQLLDALGSYRVIEPVDRKEAIKLLSAEKRKAKKSNNWFPYFTKSEIIADLRQGFASTIHKAQGSTYDKVIIDLYDINEHCFDKETLARLMYVAISRARTQVVFHGKLSERFYY